MNSAGTWPRPQCTGAPAWSDRRKAAILPPGTAWRLPSEARACMALCMPGAVRRLAHKPAPTGWCTLDRPHQLRVRLREQARLRDGVPQGGLGLPQVVHVQQAGLHPSAGQVRLPDRQVRCLLAGGGQQEAARVLQPCSTAVRAPAAGPGPQSAALGHVPFPSSVSCCCQEAWQCSASQAAAAWTTGAHLPLQSFLGQPRRGLHVLTPQLLAARRQGPDRAAWLPV